MAETDKSGRLSPADEKKAANFFSLLEMHPEDQEIANPASRNAHMGASTTEMPEQLMRRLSEISDPYDLLTPEARERLSRTLEESGRIYRQGLNDAADLPLS